MTDPLEQEALREDARFRTSPHHGDRGWMAFDLEGDRIDWAEITELLETAYRQVADRRLVEKLRVALQSQSRDASANWSSTTQVSRGPSQTR